jgi:hypothetical protein
MKWALPPIYDEIRPGDEVAGARTIRPEAFSSGRLAARPENRSIVCMNCDFAGNEQTYDLGQQMFQHKNATGASQ